MNKQMLPPLAHQASKKLADKQSKYLWKAVRLFYENPVALSHGKGTKIWDEDGNEYLDFFGGILTTSLGHSHKTLSAAIQKQVEKLIHTSPLYPHKNQADLAEKLASIMPEGLNSSLFTNSGTEANEMAVLAAREFTGNMDFFVLQHAYHGGSNLAKTMTGQHTWRFKSNSSPNIFYTHNAYCYRCPLKLKRETCGTACAQQLENNIKTMTSGKIAAIICEPIQGVGGFVTPPLNFFSIVQEIVKHYGGLFIADEVQGGFGRTGKHWFSVSHWGVKPDMITMAKGIANGFPMGAVTTKKEISDAVSADKGLLLNTFGGNPISSLAALTTIEVLSQEADPEKIEKTGSFFQKGLERLQEKYPLIGEVRGKGLMLGLELVKDQKSKEPAVQEIAKLFEATKARGLLIGKGGLYGNVVRLSPPLTVTEQEVGQALQILDDSLAAL